MINFLKKLLGIKTGFDALPMNAPRCTYPTGQATRDALSSQGNRKAMEQRFKQRQAAAASIDVDDFVPSVVRNAGACYTSNSKDAPEYPSNTSVSHGSHHSVSGGSGGGCHTSSHHSSYDSGHSSHSSSSDHGSSFDCGGGHH